MPAGYPVAASNAAQNTCLETVMFFPPSPPVFSGVEGLTAPHAIGAF
jgi:hypothetical protein